MLDGCNAVGRFGFGVLPQCSDTARFHHHGERGLHGEFQPALREGAEDVAVSDLTMFMSR